jgi:hypothetical protein
VLTLSVMIGREQKSPRLLLWMHET